MSEPDRTVPVASRDEPSPGRDGGGGRRAALNDASLRGSAEVWLDAAYQGLVEGGVDAVKILPLAGRLGLARTSFYWFFKDREELLSALADRWTGKNTGGLV